MKKGAGRRKDIFLRAISEVIGTLEISLRSCGINLKRILLQALTFEFILFSIGQSSTSGNISTEKISRSSLSILIKARESVTDRSAATLAPSLSNPLQKM